jgi:phenylalanyl-tRNA synthetase beta chain
MKFSEKWLREWVNPNIDTQTLAEQLTMAGLETDSLTPVAGKFDNVIIGQIEDAVQHPKADRLRVCQVNVGHSDKLLNIVCGAPNARAGIKVAVAMIGAVLPNGMEITRAKLRDVESEGMLCSVQELGISDVSEGILELPEDASLGQNLRDYLDLNDTIIEIGITPNRGDCLSILGIAREVAAFNHCQINEPIIKPIIEKISDTKKIKIECPEGCGAYLGRVIKNIRQNNSDNLNHSSVQATLRKLVNCINRAGTRSISPVVDVTNYVLYELGQPLHAFDLDTIQGDICVRLSRDGETIELLDEQTITLKAGTLLIADDGGPIALAGIMGGLRTAVTEATKNIFLECAWFTPEMIAGKARQYTISTDAAHRFERGVDPALQQKALTRAINLIQEISGGNVGPECSDFDVKNQEKKRLESLENKEPKIITLNIKSINRVLGISLTENNIQNLENSFNALGLKVLSKNNKANDNFWTIQIPSYRSDINIPEDLIEEAARVYGYQNIPTTPITSTLQANAIPENKISTTTFCDTLIARGYHEIISYSFVNEAKQKTLYPEGGTLKLLNPISSEYTDMRKGLWSGLIEAAMYNHNRQTFDLRLFEQGTRFIFENNQVTEKPVLAGLCSGNQVDLQWNEVTRPMDFYDVKGDVEALLALKKNTPNPQLAQYRFESEVHPALHPGQTARILSADLSSNQQSIGWIGALHPELAKQWDFASPVFLFELDLDMLSETAITEYQKLSKFQASRRDISFVIDSKISVQAVLDCIQQQDSDLLSRILSQVKVFDVYQGANIAENQKSLAIALIFQHPERTLIESEINDLMEKITQALYTTFSITLRQ